MSGFNVQCLNGHVSKAPSGSDLEKRCIERKQRGFLDALCLSEEECPDCIDELRSQRVRDALVYDDFDTEE